MTAQTAKPLLPFLRHAAAWACVYLLTLPFYTNNQFAHPGWHNLLAIVLAMGFYYLNAYGLVPRYYERGRAALYLAVAGGAGLLLTLARMALESWLFADNILRAFPSRGRYFFYAAAWFTLAGLLGGFSEILRHRRAAEARAQAIIQQQQESQLLYLRSQINPHFLFNTLNNIYALAIAGAPQTVDSVLRLASLLRYAIYSTRQPLVRAGAEIELIEELLVLYQLRHAAPVRITLAVEAAARAAQLEPMLLIPLVENCLKHGDLDYNPTGFVRLHLRLETGLLVFEAENSFNSADQAKDATPGVGLDNIRRRLALTYPAGAATLATRVGATAFTAVLRLPLSEGAREAPSRAA